LSRADELYYGGAAGGGKSDLLLGLAITAHRRSVIYRREFSQFVGPAGLIERSREILQDVAKYNGQEHAWRDIPPYRAALEFGGVQYERDKYGYQGRPHDLVAFDEITEFTQSQYEFLIAWARSTSTRVRIRVVAAGNPPATPEGDWIKRYWGPWLDNRHPNPAKPGELRWFASIDGKSEEVKSGEPFDHNGEQIIPKSRTFIPALLEDNPYLADTGYRSVLQGLPEPLRSQLLFGDFTVGTVDNPWQVIPTEWVRLAQARWEERERPDVPLTAVGIDVARGGGDTTVLAPRYDNWFDELQEYPGSSTPDGPSVATLVVGLIGEDKDAQLNVDVIGVGGAVVDALEAQDLNVFPVNAAEGTTARDKSGRLKMRNVRSELMWGMREALDPTGDDIALPPDNELLADLTAPTWKVTTSGVLIESKDDVKKRLGRSPNKGDAVVLARYTAPAYFS